MPLKVRNRMNSDIHLSERGAIARFLVYNTATLTFCAKIKGTANCLRFIGLDRISTVWYYESLL